MLLKIYNVAMYDSFYAKVTPTDNVFSRVVFKKCLGAGRQTKYINFIKSMNVIINCSKLVLLHDLL